MLAFHPIALSDKCWIEKYFSRFDNPVCNYTFANLFLWKTIYRTECCDNSGFLLIRFYYADSDKCVYLEPIGEGNVSEILALLQDDARQMGQPLRMESLSREFVEKVKKLPVGGNLFFFKNRDVANYVYEAELLRTLAGKNLQAKRNHIRKFEQLYPDYTSRPLSADDARLALALFDQWEVRKLDHNRQQQMERVMIESAFAHYNALGLEGLLLLVEGVVVAFTFGSRLNKDSFCVHVEKANSDFEGAFAIINKLMAQSLSSSYKYINREEDMGNENLRKAKLSYHPALLLNNFQALAKDSEEAAVWKLWQTCFGDSDEFLVAYMFPYSNAESRVLLYDTGKLVAMFHAHSFLSDWGKVGYLYGLGTEPKLRGKGLGCRVIEDSLRRLKNRGDMVAWIIQENKDFNCWEHRFGFAPAGNTVLHFKTPDGFDFGGDPENDWGLCRVLFAHRYLQKYMDLHPETQAEFYFCDDFFPENSGHYVLQNGQVSFIPCDDFENAEKLLPADLLVKYPLEGGTELKYIRV